MRKMTITPEVAKEMLKKNTNNRPLSKRTLSRYVQLMKNGKYVIMKRPFILKNKADELLQKISLSVKNDKMKNYISN